MNLLFYKMRTGKKGQIVAMLTVALVIFIIAAFIVVNLGKSKIQDTKINNAAQAAVLAGGSSASILLNSMANLNDQMVLNFVGFTYMTIVILTSWIVDYGKAVLKAFKTLIPYNWSSGAELGNAIGELGWTTAIIPLMISGARTVGNSVVRMIRELNVKLPKNSRDSARQYAFSNAGVDEPKLPFSKSGCSDAWCYSLLETKFDEFMRALPAKNKADMDYGASKIEFDWDDSRNANIVQNKVAVTVTPVQEVPFDTIKFSEVSSRAQEINDYLDTQPRGLLLGPIIKFGVSNADFLNAILSNVVNLIAALAGLLSAIAAVEFLLAALNATACIFGCGECCKLAAYYTFIAPQVAAAATVAAAEAAVFSAFYTDPGDIPCFVWEERREHPISAEVTRTTTPSSINYGIYETNWPEQTHAASGTVKDGSIFPPNQNFDIIPNF